ncbi:MAG TPA: oxaloacetate-decarboxylating malate dehydrogenase, partial [Gammaproteobacteria bacterium]|nr:oxaloacetate-decarboxylating malate dehydrogenase [Gammaproteobacteria bacterium]
QWEDFRKDNALTILDRYSSVLPSFNDDIQGTGAVVMAGLNSALKIKNERLSQQRIVIFGAGAAGLGVSRQIRAQLVDEGVIGDAATGVIAVLDRAGLLVDDGRPMDEYKRALAWSAERATALNLAAPTERSLLDVVRKYRPTVLIGLSGVAGAFNEAVVREMAKHVERPAIFPSSNPSASSEAVPADLYRWTDCRCLVATGSPFPNVDCNGKVYRVGQGNNVFIFPGLGLAAIAANARKVTDAMTKVASEALAAQVTNEEREAALLFPSVTRLRAVSFEIAVAVARQAIKDGVAGCKLADVERLVREARWSHDYADYVPA